MIDQNNLTPPPLSLHLQGAPEPESFQRLNFDSAPQPAVEPVTPAQPPFEVVPPAYADMPPLKAEKPKSSKRSLIAFALILIAFLAIGTGAWSYVQNKKTQLAQTQVTKSQDFSQVEPDLEQNPNFVQVLPNSNSATTSATPVATASSKPISKVKPVATPVATPAATSSASTTIPANWAKFDFPQANLVLFAPKAWHASLEQFQDTQSKLIRLWQGANQSTATIQLNVKNNWDNTGDAQFQPRTFKIDATTLALKIDPPQASEKKLDRYQTEYYFEKNNHVYVLDCVHNWIPEQYQLCQDILTNIQFK